MRILKLLLVAVTAPALSFVGCTADDGGGSAIVFKAEAEPLGGFSKDTGLIPAGSPAQVSLAFSAGGKVSVDAAGEATKSGVKGKPGTGKLALDVHVKMDGRLKIDTSLKKVDEDLPGLKDIDVPIVGEAKFDPFVVHDGESAKVDVAVPETQLPDIPLGSVPGKLQLTIATGSTLTSTFEGGCISVAGGKAKYTGVAHTSGKLVLKGTIVLELPAPLDKSVDLGDIEVPVPNVDAPLDFPEKAAPGAGDGHDGRTCPASGDAAGGDVDGGSSSGGGEPTSDETFDLTVEQKPVTLDGLMYAQLDKSTGAPFMLVTGRNAANDHSISLNFSGAPGTYTCGSGAGVVYIVRTSTTSTTYGAPGTQGGNCTITVNSVGNVGDYVDGTVTAIVQSDTQSVLSLSGSFHVKRDADKP